MRASERPRGVFSRQLVLGNNLATDQITADYHDGVLRLRIPVSERAKPRKITVGRPGERPVVTHNGDALREPAHA
jgi:HSP20 family protein